MHILYFHQHFSTPKGSVGIRSYQMAQALIRNGHSVTMVCGSYKGGQTGLTSDFSGGRRQGVVDGIYVIELALSYSNSDGFMKRFKAFATFAFKSIGIAMREKYDIVFATTTPLTAGIPGIFARWLRAKPFVFEVRDLWPELPREMGVIKNPIILWMMGVLEWVSYRSAHRCVALSPGIAKGIERCGVAASKITLVPNGCDIDIFKDPKAKAWRPKGVANNDLMAVFSGTQGQANGLDDVLDAAVELQTRKVKNIKLVLVGQGKLTEHLKARVKAEGLDNVLMLPPVPKKELAGLFKSTDIGMQCLANIPAFYYGTSPNKFFDYISAELPVLNNYPGWVAEMVEENECGFKVNAQDPKAFADALQKAADDKAKGGTLLKRMGKNSFKLAKVKFDRNNLSNKWVKWVTNEKMGA